MTMQNNFCWCNKLHVATMFHSEHIENTIFVLENRIFLIYPFFAASIYVFYKKKNDSFQPLEFWWSFPFGRVFLLNTLP